MEPTSFIRMAASSLDNSLLSYSSPRARPHSFNAITHLQQLRDEKQYIHPESMIHFKQNMDKLGDEFERAQYKLSFSTNSSVQHDDFALRPNHSITHSTNHQLLPNITVTPSPNTSLPLPLEQPLKISSIGSAIDQRLQNLKAKLSKLEQEDHQAIISNNHETPSSIISLPPLRSPTSLNNSFSEKYQQYMQRYHGGAQANQARIRQTNDVTSHSFPEYNTTNLQQKSKKNAQSLVNKIRERSKCLFDAANCGFKTKHAQKDNERVRAHIVGKSSNLNFDDRLNSSWRRTEFQINKIKKMNEHFQSKYDGKMMNDSIASSHWTLDSQLQTTHLLPQLQVSALDVVNEQSIKSSHSFHTVDSYKSGSAIGGAKAKKEDENVINFSFNDRGIQVRVPSVCSECNKRMTSSDIKVITLQNERDYEQKQLEFDEQVVFQKQQICATSTSSSLEIKSTLSEMDRKRLIMDLKNMDGDYSDCRSDGILISERKRKKGKTLRAKVENLKMSMQIDKTNNEGMEVDEWSYLKNKLRIYEDKLRSIDPTLLE